MRVEWESCLLYEITLVWWGVYLIPLKQIIMREWEIEGAWEMYRYLWAKESHSSLGWIFKYRQTGMTGWRGYLFMTSASFSNLLTPSPLVRIFTQPPFLNSLLCPLFQDPLPPSRADVINGSSLRLKIRIRLVFSMVSLPKDLWTNMPPTPQKGSQGGEQGLVRKLSTTPHLLFHFQTLRTNPMHILASPGKGSSRVITSKCLDFLSDNNWPTTLKKLPNFVL